MKRLDIDPEKLVEHALIEAQDGIDGSEPEIDDTGPEFYPVSDVSIEIGKGQYSREVLIRHLIPSDFEEIFKKIPDILLQVQVADQKNAADPSELVTDAITKMATSTGKKSAEIVSSSHYEILGYCLNISKRDPVVSKSFLKSLTFGEQSRTLKAIWAVNSEEFGDLKEILNLAPDSVKKLLSPVLDAAKCVSVKSSAA